MTKLMTLGAEVDGPIKYEIHGKVTLNLYRINFNFSLFIQYIKGLL